MLSYFRIEVKKKKAANQLQNKPKSVPLMDGFLLSQSSKLIFLSLQLIFLWGVANKIQISHSWIKREPILTFITLTNAGNLASTFPLLLVHLQNRYDKSWKLWNIFFVFKQNIFYSPLSHSLLQRDLSWPQLLPTTNSDPQNPISVYMSSDNNPASHTLRPWLHYKDPIDPPPESLTLKKAASLVFFLFFPLLSMPFLLSHVHLAVLKVWPFEVRCTLIGQKCSLGLAG